MSVFGINFSYQVRGGTLGRLGMHQMRAAFERAGAEMVQFGEHVFPRVIRLLEKEIKGQFEAEGRGPNRGKWKPLSQTYAKWKAEHYPGRTILRRTNRLYNALTKSRNGGALRYYTAREMRFGTALVPHASFHQVGTQGGLLSRVVKAITGGRRGLPDRPPLDFTPEFDANLAKTAKTAALAAIREHVRPFARVRDDAGLDNRLDFLLGGDE